MANKFGDTAATLLGIADKMDGNPGMLGAQTQIIQSSGLFAIAAAIQDLATATREATEQRRLDDIAVRTENGK